MINIEISIFIFSVIFELYYNCIVTRTISTEMCEVVQHEAEKAGKLWDKITLFILSACIASLTFTFFLWMHPSNWTCHSAAILSLTDIPVLSDIYNHVITDCIPAAGLALLHIQWTGRCSKCTSASSPDEPYSACTNAGSEQLISWLKGIRCSIRTASALNFYSSGSDNVTENVQGHQPIKMFEMAEIWWLNTYCTCQTHG